MEEYDENSGIGESYTKSEQKKPLHMEHTKGPWKAHLNVPTAQIEGHIIKTAYGAECPIASLWVGGGTKGKPRQVANAQFIAAAPALLEACETVLDDTENYSVKPPYWKQLVAAIAAAKGE